MMNKRIKELISKATSLEKGPPNWDMTENTVIEEFDREKFAELIIKDCIELIKQAIPETGCSAAGAYRAARIAAVSRIEQEFHR